MIRARCCIPALTGNYLFRMVFLIMTIWLVNGCRTTPPAVSVEVEKPEEVEAVVETFEIEGLDRLYTGSGLEYAVVEPGSGVALEREMYVSLHYTGFFDDEKTVFDSSRQRGEPITFILGRNMVIPGWEEALINLRVGDKARLWIPSHLAYGKEGRGPIPPGADLVFDLEILDAASLTRPEPFSVEGLDTLDTESGLQYIMVREGSGNTPLNGQIVVIHYTGFLTDGTMIDSSVQRNEPFRFVLGTSQVIRGLDEGITFLQEGGRARFIIPPDLAYGDRGIGPVPPASVLIFDVELIYIEN